MQTETETKAEFYAARITNILPRWLEWAEEEFINTVRYIWRQGPHPGRDFESSVFLACSLEDMLAEIRTNFGCKSGEELNALHRHFQGKLNHCHGITVQSVDCAVDEPHAEIQSFFTGGLEYQPATLAKLPAEENLIELQIRLAYTPSPALQH